MTRGRKQQSKVIPRDLFLRTNSAGVSSSKALKPVLSSRWGGKSTRLIALLAGMLCQSRAAQCCDSARIAQGSSATREDSTLNVKNVPQSSCCSGGELPHPGNHLASKTLCVCPCSRFPSCPRPLSNADLPTVGPRSGDAVSPEELKGNVGFALSWVSYSMAERC